MKEELTQSTLAALAANLPAGDARQRATLAIDIWDEAGRALAERKCRQILERDPAEAAEAAEPWPLDRLLRAAMPKASTADRTKAYRDFIADSHGDDAAVSVLAGERENGVQYASTALRMFTEWLDRRKAGNLSERAAKGAAAKKGKKNLDTEKSAKKRNKQAKIPGKQPKPPDK